MHVKLYHVCYKRSYLFFAQNKNIKSYHIQIVKSGSSCLKTLTIHLSFTFMHSSCLVFDFLV